MSQSVCSMDHYRRASVNIPVVCTWLEPISKHDGDNPSSKRKENSHDGPTSMLSQHVTSNSKREPPKNFERAMGPDQIVALQGMYLPRNRLWGA